MSPLLAQSGHHAAEFRCLLLGVKRTSARHSFNGRGSVKKAASKKIANTGGITFLRFQNWVRGCHPVHMPFCRSRRERVAFVFFNTARRAMPEGPSVQNVPHRNKRLVHSS